MNKPVLFIIIFLSLIAPAFLVFAVTGAIDSTYKYAWSSNMGWINFGCANCSVQITDSAITGYAWSRNYGWIKLNPANGGVTNTASGDLSGYAWSADAGWINFENASIDCSGQFKGTATGSNAGTINFDCSNCKVLTDWRPSSGCGGGGVSYSHSACISSETGNHCMTVSGQGENSCATDSDCIICDPHGDINKDSKINIVDFSILMYYWMQTNPANKCADINKDGIVNLRDFSIMLYWWTA